MIAQAGWIRCPLVARPRYSLGELRYIELDIDVDADTCYRLLCDIDSVPRWVEGVTDVRILERDDAGRAVLARFVGGDASTPTAYTLRYGYDDERRTVRWRIEDANLRDLDGEAVVTALAPRRCRLRYGLHASTLVFRATGVGLQDESPERAADAFRRWAEDGTE